MMVKHKLLHKRHKYTYNIARGENVISIGVAEENNHIKELIKNLNKEDIYIFDCTDKNNIKSADIIINNNGRVSGNVHCKIYIYNSDEKTDTVLDEGTLIITYGLNSLATATASSIDEGNGFQYCLQRSICGLSGKKIEPQEFHAEFNNREINIHSALAFETLLLLYNY